MTSKFEVVISGISGRFPKCEDVHTLQEKLCNLENCISEKNGKWAVGYEYKFNEQMTIPGYIGKYTNDLAYDSDAFKLTSKFSRSNDPPNRKVLEPSFEAIVDAGISPYTLKGRNIAVFGVTGINETDQCLQVDDTSSLALIGSSKSMLSNRISFVFDFTGPSFTFHSDPLGDLQAVSQAYYMISEGYVEAAIIATSSHILNLKLSLQFIALNFLSSNGQCRSFDKFADGFVRSEATVVLFLQKADDAKRNYGSIVACDTFYYGFRDTTLVGYEESELSNFLKSIYTDDSCKKLLDEISFVELSGYGNQKRDTCELNAVADVFGKNSKKPTLVGSITSNIGNTGVSSAYMSLLKIILAFNNGVIAPNMNFTEPNDKIRALKNQILQVITKPTKMTGNVAAVNWTGLTSTFSHMALQQNERTESTNEGSLQFRLLLICGRTEDGLKNAIKKIENLPYNPEFVSLTNDVFVSEMPFHIYRGYTVLPKYTDSYFEVKERGDNKRPIWFVFSGMGSQWNEMGRDLLKLPIFADIVERCHSILQTKGINIYDILISKDPAIFDNILHSFVGIGTIQIGLFEVLKKLKIHPDGIIGHSAGENICAYADNCFTLEEAILATYERGKASTDTVLIKGMMAAVGKSYDQIKDSLPEDVMVGCHNSSQNCTITGPADKVHKFVEQLQKNGVFARSVNVSNTAFHSKYVAPVAPKLLSSLKKIIKNPKKISSKWISTSIPESEWHKPSSQYCSAEYMTNNLTNPVLFEEGCRHIPANAVVIEIAPRGLLQAILKHSLPSTCTNLSLTHRSAHQGGIRYLLSVIGRLYIEGYQPDINELFPKISYPVQRNTPSISPFCTWLRDEERNKRVYHCTRDQFVPMNVIPLLIVEDAEYNYLRYHKCEGQGMIPTSFLMYLVWKALLERKNEDFGTSTIIFEDVIVHKNLEISITDPKFVSILIGTTGNFELIQFDDKNQDETTIILSGVINTSENTERHVSLKPLETINVQLSHQQIYNIFEKHGYQLENCFSSIKTISYNETEYVGKIKWTENWVSLLDSLLKFDMFTSMKKMSDILYPSFIRHLSICSHQFTTKSKGTIITCYKRLGIEIIQGDGVELREIKYNHSAFMKKPKSLEVKGYKFITYKDPECQTSEEFIELCLHVATESIKLNAKSDNAVLCIKQITNICSRTILTIIERNESLKMKVRIQHSMDINAKEIPSENKYFLLVATCQNEILQLSNLECTFLLIADTTLKFPEKLLQLYVPVMEQKFSNLRYCLLKKKVTAKLPVIESYSEKKNSKMNASVEQQPSIIIQKNINSFNLPIIISNRKRRDKNRYLFLLDDFNDIEEEISLIKSQIVLDLPISILWRGKWGFYNNIHCEGTNFTSICNGSTSVNIQLKSVKVRYLCSDLKTNVELISKKNEYGIEYAGEHTSGMRVMGLALVNNSELTSEMDPLLTWTVPDTWSLENAATVPLIYSQVYYISQLIYEGQKELSILLNVGDQNCLAQASISVWLAKGFSIFISVPDANQKTLIQEKFPTLESFRILDQDKCAYEQQILLLTNGKGVDVVVNCAVGINHINASLRCLGTHTKYIEIGNGNCNYFNKMDLFTFLKTVSFIILPNKISKLLTLPQDIKKTIKEDLEAGLRQGIVVPFSNEQSLEKLIECGDTNIGKLRRYFLEGKTKAQINCKLRMEGNLTYIIIGDQKNSEWFQVIEWLSSKGVLNFVVVVDNSKFSSKLSTQIDQFLNQRKSKINFVEPLGADSVNGATQIISYANKIAPVEAVIFVSLDQNGSKMRCMDIASRKINPNTQFISLFSGGLHECEERRCKGSPAVVIHSENYQKKMPSVLSKIFSLLTSNELFNIPTLLEIYDNEVSSEVTKTAAELKEFLPKDMETLLDIGRNISDKPTFFEISTSCSRYKHTRGVYPAFVIPAIHSVRLQPLMRKLAFPAFCSTISYSPTDSIVDMTKDLLVSLNKIQPTGPVTIISETWNVNLVIQLSTLLEDNGRQYKLFLLEPRLWKNHVQNLGIIGSPEFEANLIQQIFSFDSKINTKIGNVNGNVTFEDQLKCYLTTTALNEDERKSVTTAVLAMRKIILMSSQHNVEVLLKNTTLFERRLMNKLPLNLSVTSNIKIIKENSYDNFVSCSDVCDTINQNAAFSWWEYTKVDV